MNRAGWNVVLVAAALTALATGGRNVLGVFVSPLNTASGLGLATISLAMAFGQLGLGVAQPWIGQWADRSGASRVIVIGATILAVAAAMPALSLRPVVVFASLVLSATAAGAVGSPSLLLGPVNRAVGLKEAGIAMGIVGAGASTGQLILGPLLQWIVGDFGWRAGLLTFAAISLFAFPLARQLGRLSRAPAPAARPHMPVAGVLREGTFWRYALSYAACGLHVAFLSIHMPGAIERCQFPVSLAGLWFGIAGAANIAGSIAVGIAMRRFVTGNVLAAVYLARAASIALFVVAPATVTGLMLFGVVMGATFMATLPPTSALVAERYGIARLGTLIGVITLVHQLGSFAGVWLGGLLAQTTGKDTVFWTLDIALALVAALLVLPRAGAATRPLFTTPGPSVLNPAKGV